MLKASDGCTSASINNSATSQHVDSNCTTISSSAVGVDTGMLQDAKADVKDQSDQIAGFIFMCNGGTKPDCFMYRVFGLPASRIKVVKNIKPNTKLFLFDFDVKLLYGLYVADTCGMMALEPHAFGGKFPAQVKFSIVEDCLPVPEVVFKDAIKEIYYGRSKFKQELNDEQANKLVSLFRPINIPSPQQPSPAFVDSLRKFYQKCMESSQQVNSVPEVPQVASASSYYGQSSMPQFTMSPGAPAVAPSSSMLPSSLRASQLVEVASQALNAEDQTSKFMPPLSNKSGLSHAHMSYNGSNIREVGYGYQDQGNPNSHQDKPVSDGTVHAYEVPPYYVNSYYQNQGDATLPQTLASGSTGVRVDNTYLNYDSRNHPASISYGYTHYQVDPALPHIRPPVNSSWNNQAVGFNLYNSNNSATLAHDYRTQGYYGGHQTAVGTSVQQNSYVPDMHRSDWPTAPSGYMNQDYYNSKSSRPF